MLVAPSGGWLWTLISFLPKRREITKEDLCWKCVECALRPGTDSICQPTMRWGDWPAVLNDNGKAVSCEKYVSYGEK